MLVFCVNYHNETCSVFVPSHPLSLFSSLFLFVAAFTYFQITIYYFTPSYVLFVTSFFLTIPHYLVLSNLVFPPTPVSPVLHPLQRCQCHPCYACPQSESCQFRWGNSTHRVLSWLPCTHLSTPVALAMHISNASSTGPCWFERHQGTQTKHNLVFSTTSTKDNRFSCTLLNDLDKCDKFAARFRQ